jgi:DNA-binding NarL/FixJ family response regulator
MPLLMAWEFSLPTPTECRPKLLTSALRRHSEFHITHCQMDSSSILQAVSSKPPRIAVLSLNRSGNASETVMTLRRFHLADPDIPKILLVESSDRELVISAFRSGARGIFSIADANHRLLCKCLLRANTEQLNYAMDLVSEVPSLRVINARGGSLLTPREEQVVALVAEGLGNARLQASSISANIPSRNIFPRIFEKLGVSTRAELVLYAVNNGDPRQAEWLAGPRRVPPSV